MDPNNMSGAATNPLSQEVQPPVDSGQPTTYVPPEIPPEIRARGTLPPVQASGQPTAPAPSSAYPGQPTQYGDYAPQPHPPSQDYTAGPADYRAQRRAQREAWRAARRHHSPVLGPLLLISAGVVFLLNNLGVLPWGVWEALGRLWPLFLIAIGIDLVLGRRRPLISAVLVVVVIATAAGFVYYNGGLLSSGAIVSTPLSVPLQGASAASLRLEMGIGDLNLHALDSEPGRSNFAGGTLQYYQNYGAPNKNISPGSSLDVDLSQNDKGFNLGFLTDGPRPSWDIGLSGAVSVSLNVESGTGNVVLDLSSTKLTDLHIDAGTGNMSVTLPSPTGQSSVEINGGTGNIELLLPAGVAARLTVDTGLGKVTVDPSFAKSGEDTYSTPNYSGETANRYDIQIDGGVGNISVRGK